MSQIRQRNQNPVTGDTICLKLYTQNSNLFSDVYSIDHIDIVEEYCREHDDGRHHRDERHHERDEPERHERLVETIPNTAIIHPCPGIYKIELATPPPLYTIGRYHDVWFVQFKEDDVISPIAQDFQIYPDLWITSPTPVVYSFDFHFTPNRIRQGSKKWLIIQIIPNVPKATDLERYYHNLAISAELKINIELNCGPCPPHENDLIIEDEPVIERDKVFSYYKIDTSDLDCGIYNVWFELCYAGNVEVSPKMQLQIF